MTGDNSGAYSSAREDTCVARFVNKLIDSDGPSRLSPDTMESIFETRERNAALLDAYSVSSLVLRKDVQRFSLCWAQAILDEFGKHWVSSLEMPAQPIKQALRYRAPLRLAASYSPELGKQQYHYSPAAQSLCQAINFDPLSQAERRQLRQIGLSSLKLDQRVDGAILKLTWLRLERMLHDYSISNAARWPGYRLQTSITALYDSVAMPERIVLGFSVLASLQASDSPVHGRGEPCSWEAHEALLMDEEQLAEPEESTGLCCYCQ